MPLSLETKRETYDAGIRAAAAHLLDGAPPPCPPRNWGPVRKHYFRRAADGFAAALSTVLERSP